MEKAAIRRINTEMEANIDVEARSLSGYGIVFNSDSHGYDMTDENGEPVKVFEQIRRESLAGVSFDDVIVSYNHREEMMLGRSSAGTAFFEIDERGVSYSVRKMPNTSYANDLLEMMQRGEVKGSSFWFVPDWEAGWEFEKRSDGNYTSYPRKIKRVVEMGPVVFPAYPETSAELRSAFEKHVKKEKDPAEAAFRQQQQHLKNIIAINTIRQT